MTVTQAHLQHPDFTADFARREIEALEALMDAELEKGDAADFDLIDACADAVNALRSGADAAVLPPTSHKAFMKAIGVRKENGARIAIAAGLAAALLLAAASQLHTGEDITGSPSAMASSTTRGSPSAFVGNTNMSVCLIASLTALPEGSRPRKLTRSATPFSRA